MTFDEVTINDFETIKMAVGRINSADEFPEARKPAYKLVIDFGDDIGIKKSSVQITQLYKREELLGRLVIAVVNFPPRQIGPFMSECLTLGVPDEVGNVVLLAPDQDVPLGGLVF